jgi:hypothetical protein
MGHGLYRNHKKKRRAYVRAYFAWKQKQISRGNKPVVGALFGLAKKLQKSTTGLLLENMSL